MYTHLLTCKEVLEWYDKELKGIKCTHEINEQSYNLDTQEVGMEDVYLIDTGLWVRVCHPIAKRLDKFGLIR